MPDCCSRIFKSDVFGPLSLKAMAPLRYAAKFDPFLSLDCAPTPSTLAQSKERKGSNFAIWRPWFYPTCTATAMNDFAIVFSLLANRCVCPFVHPSLHSGRGKEREGRAVKQFCVYFSKLALGLVNFVYVCKLTWSTYKGKIQKSTIQINTYKTCQQPLQA